MIFDRQFVSRAEELIALLRRKKMLMATAESCTGGLIAGLITSVPGSSKVFEAGFVTYSNEAKSRMIGVPLALIQQMGAVSEEVARAMASGVLTHSSAAVAIAVTGVAGPGGGTALKPVGLVHCAAAHRDGTVRHEVLQLGDTGRENIRLATVAYALEMLYDLADGVP